MTPGQVDAWTNALIRLHDMTALYGPGLLLVAACVAAWWLARRIAALGLRLRDAARIRRRWNVRDLEHYANQPEHPRYADAPARKENRP